MCIPTPHIDCKDKSLIAKTVLMPGDPLRAKFIAETFLEDVIQVNSVRNMFGYTGTYKGKKLTVFGSGMGMPSMGIYSFELFKFYDVENIIRIGSCGAYSEDLKLYDVLLSKDVYSESSFAKTQSGYDKDVLESSAKLNEKVMEVSKKINIPVTETRLHSSDVFYRNNFEDFKKIRDEHGCVAVEMESFALLANARELGKQATCIFTVSDSLVSGEVTTSEERQLAFTKMMEVALETAITL